MVLSSNIDLNVEKGIAVCHIFEIDAEWDFLLQCYIKMLFNVQGFYNFEFRLNYMCNCLVIAELEIQIRIL